MYNSVRILREPLSVLFPAPRAVIYWRDIRIDLPIHFGLCTAQIRTQMAVHTYTPKGYAQQPWNAAEVSPRLPTIITQDCAYYVVRLPSSDITRLSHVKSPDGPRWTHQSWMWANRHETVPILFWTTGIKFEKRQNVIWWLNPEVHSLVDQKTGLSFFKCRSAFRWPMYNCWQEESTQDRPNI